MRAMKHFSLQSLPEEDLAPLQSLQKGNDCAVHAIAAAIQLLCGLRLNPVVLVEELNRLWWRGHFYRLAPGWAIPPTMQARLINRLAQELQLPICARLEHSTPEALINSLLDPARASLVTIYWLYGQVPSIFYGRRAENYNATRLPGGHTMLFGAYDPEHTNGEGKTSPWGFVNSWVDGGKALFWMEDEAFRRAWRLLPGAYGRNATVAITRSAPALADKVRQGLFSADILS